MSDPLYKKELLRLAADAMGAGRLFRPDGSATAHNRACGDRVTMDVAVNQGRIADIAHDTKACVLTQASASILGAALTGLSHTEVAALAERVRAMLAGSEAPAAPFYAYAAFDGVGAHASRHKCVLLPFEAVLAALENSDSRKPGG